MAPVCRSRLQQMRAEHWQELEHLLAGGGAASASAQHSARPEAVEAAANSICVPLLDYAERGCCSLRLCPPHPHRSQPSHSHFRFPRADGGGGGVCRRPCHDHGSPAPARSLLRSRAQTRAATRTVPTPHFSNTARSAAEPFVGSRNDDPNAGSMPNDPKVGWSMTRAQV